MYSPRVRGVFEYLAQHGGQNENLNAWIRAHEICLEAAFGAVASIYAADSARQNAALKRSLEAADPDWAGKGSFSQKAIRTIRSTAGVNAVLLGMRRTAYVDDVVTELQVPIGVQERRRSWEQVLPEYFMKLFVHLSVQRRIQHE